MAGGIGLAKQSEKAVKAFAIKAEPGKKLADAVGCTCSSHLPVALRGASSTGLTARRSCSRLARTHRCRLLLRVWNWAK